MKNTINNMKGLIIGCGSIGTRHLHNLKKIGIRDIAICDEDKKKVDDLAKKYNTKKFYDLNSALTFEPNFSIVSTYPSSHTKLASHCIAANSHVFIEKPISSDLIGVKDMLKKADTKKLKVAVGYNLRYDPGLKFVKTKLKNLEISSPLSILSEWGHNIALWKPGTNFKNHYILKKGSGIILDDSHEYDYVRWLLDDDVKSVYCQTRQMRSIKTQTESLAIMTLKFKKGVIANFVMDYIRPNYERRCHIIGEKGDMKWEYVPQYGSWKDYSAKASSTVTTSLLDNKGTRRNNFVVKSNNMYLNEIQDFIHSIIQDKKPHVDGWEGLKTLKIGVTALLSAKTNKIIKF